MKRNRFKIAGIVFAVIILACAGFCAYYVNDYYHSEKSAEALLNGSETVTVSEINEGLFVDGMGEDSAIIFYPGAKVEYTAYLPLFMELAEQGVDSFLVKMPCNLAMFGMNKAGDIMQSYDYENWYLAGHSLGGAMGAAYVAEHIEDFDGIIFLASYPTKDLKAENFEVLSIYGSEDTVLNMEKVEEGRNFMPENYTEVRIEGGNHAQFGAYGLQEGDGVATIAAAEQVQQTVDAILSLVENDIIL